MFEPLGPKWSAIFSHLPTTPKHTCKEVTGIFQEILGPFCEQHEEKRRQPRAYPPLLPPAGRCWGARAFVLNRPANLAKVNTGENTLLTLSSQHQLRRANCIQASCSLLRRENKTAQAVPGTECIYAHIRVRSLCEFSHPCFEVAFYRAVTEA